MKLLMIGKIVKIVKADFRSQEKIVHFGFWPNVLRSNIEKKAALKKKIPNSGQEILNLRE